MLSGIYASKYELNHSLYYLKCCKPHNAMYWHLNFISMIFVLKINISHRKRVVLNLVCIVGILDVRYFIENWGDV